MNQMLKRRSSFEFGERDVLILQALAALIIALRYLWIGLVPSPTLLVIGVLLLLSARFQAAGFWPRLMPFLVLGLTYQSMGGLSHNIPQDQIHITDLIEWERALFGGAIPASVFQEHLIGRTFTPVLDILANGLYFSHFILPVAVGVLIWYQKKRVYWPYLLGFLGMSYLGFVTYVAFPAAPPWWAYQKGFLAEPISLDHFLLSERMMFSTPNPVAAMPSMHCAYPLYVALIASMLWQWRGTFLFLVPLGVGFSVIYLGHHYVVDILVGYAYGVIGLGLALIFLRRRWR